MFPPLTSARRAFALTCVLLGPLALSVSNAQIVSDEAIQRLPMTKAQLIPAQRAVLDKIERSPRTGRVDFVRIAKISRVQKQGHLTLRLPGDARPIQVSPKRIEARSEDDFTYIGAVPDSAGQVVITSRNGQMRGNIDLGERRFEFINLGGDVYAWITKKNTQPKGCATPDAPSSAMPVTPAPRSGRQTTCFNPFRVMIRFTPAAQAEEPNIQGLIDQCIANWQAALSNSATGTGLLNFEVVGRNVFNFNAPTGETNSLGADIGTFATQIAGERGSADLVVLIAASRDPNASGIAQQIGPNSNVFAAIVEVEEAVNEYVFNHELAHLMGARHNDCGISVTPGCDNAGTDNHGYRFDYPNGLFNRNRRRTIMHEPYQELGTFGFKTWFRINHFSNPNVTVGGCPTGTSGTHNNASVLTNNAWAVSQHRSGGEQLSAFIEGPYEGTQYGGTYTWEAVYSCGTGPYTFQWRISTDGFNYGNVLSTGEFFNSHLYSQYTYIWLRVNSSNGQQRDAYLTVYGNSGGRRSADDLAGVEAPLKTELGEIAPNPAKSSAKLRFSLAEAQPVRVVLLDAAGRELRAVADGHYEAGHHACTLPAEQLQPGFYFVRMNAGQQQFVRKWLVQP